MSMSGKDWPSSQLPWDPEVGSIGAVTRSLRSFSKYLPDGDLVLRGIGCEVAVF